jgi:hypothetical protein
MSLLRNKMGSSAAALACGLLLATGAGVVQAGESAPESSFLKVEYALMGSQATHNWRAQSSTPYLFYAQIGGQGIERDNEIGAASGPEKKESSGPSNFKTKATAGALSAVFPGAGQFYNGQQKKAFLMGGIEVAIWTTYFIFDHQGDNRLDSSIEYAEIYAGTRGEHPDSYWQSVGRYMDSDAYNESVLREARALQEEPGGLVSGSDAWQWVNEDRRTGFASLRADANSAYDRRDFMILFAVVNRAVSVVDAVLGAGAADGKLETEVLGMNLGLEMLPSWRDPGAQCVVSRRF